KNRQAHFLRPAGMLPLPDPQRGGSIDLLWDYVNHESEAQRWLMIAWLLMAFRPKGPYPILCLHGPQGSGKSLALTALRRLVDPNVADLRALPRNEHELVISADNSWVLAFDNLSHLSPTFSDALCRMSTGGGFSTRQLWTDKREVLFQLQRPILL